MSKVKVSGLEVLSVKESVDRDFRDDHRAIIPTSPLDPTLDELQAIIASQRIDTYFSASLRR